MLDSYITALDALQVINYVNANGETRAPAGGGGTSFYDVDGDGWVTSIDAELVLRYYGTPVPGNEVVGEEKVTGVVFRPWIALPLV